MNNDYLLDVSNVKPEVTKVIFRKWRGDIIALFPEEPGDRLASTCMSYSWDGHSAADYDGIIAESKPANASEYDALKHELECIGYSLRVLVKAPNGAYSKRCEIIWLAERQAQVAAIAQYN